MPPPARTLSNEELWPNPFQNHLLGVVTRGTSGPSDPISVVQKISQSSVVTRIPRPLPWWHTPLASVRSPCCLTWHLSSSCSVFSPNPSHWNVN
jgi:hypothetical protein